jgi:hypothetical protein
MCVEVCIIIVLFYFPREIIIIINRILMYVANDIEDSHYSRNYNT